jgi:hypothetical protein
MQKERENKRAKRATITLIMVKWTIQRTIEKHVRAQFNSTWFVYLGGVWSLSLEFLGKLPSTSSRI